MTSSTHDHTHISNPTSAAARPAVTDRVLAALEELDAAAFALGPLPHAATEWAARSAALALISARRAGWWRVLLVADRHSRAGAHPLYRRAVVTAHRKAQEDARFWRDTARDWQARAEHRPTSDTAGALSNWTELGVAP